MANDPVVALEIGTAKVRVLVGEEREDGYLMITGVGECASRGVRKGEITDFDHALAGVEQAFKQAEEQSKVSINEVQVALSGSHIQASPTRGTTPIIAPDGEITREHMDAVMESARAVSLPVDRHVLHSIHQQFFVDDQEGVINPEGMVGAKLSVSMLVVHGVRNRIMNVLKVPRSAGVEEVHYAFGGLCAALAVLTPEQKESGCVVIDFGAGTTDYVVYANRSIALAGSLGVGGDHLTNDLAMVLRIPPAQAERLKCECGVHPPDTAPPDKPVSLPPTSGFPGQTLRLTDINAIMHARLDETLGLILQELQRTGLHNRMGAGVVLTGGGAYLNGLDEFVAQTLQMPCAIGRPRNVSGIATTSEGPEYAVAVGLLRYGLRAEGGGDRGGWRSVWGRLFRR